MVATRCPKFISATAMCMAMVDFPAPPFSLPSTTTWADADRLPLACINITDLDRDSLPLVGIPVPMFLALQNGTFTNVAAGAVLRSSRRRDALGALLQRANAAGERAFGVVAAIGERRPAVALRARQRRQLVRLARQHGLDR